MADTQENDNSKPSDELSRGREPNAAPEPEPQTTPEEAAQDAEIEDRFEATDN